MTHPMVSASSMAGLFPLSQGQLASLARTCDRAERPMWLHDTALRCVHQNGLAAHHAAGPEEAETFEIVDHRDRKIGHLRVVVD